MLLILLCTVLVGAVFVSKFLEDGLSQPSIPSATIEPNERLWQNSNVTDYTISIFGGSIHASEYILTVVDNHIDSVIVDGVEILPEYFVEYERYTVEGLFQSARNCSFCRATFHPIYGYPSEVGGGFIESWGLRVTDFQPLTDIED